MITAMKTSDKKNAWYPWQEYLKFSLVFLDFMAIQIKTHISKKTSQSLLKTQGYFSKKLTKKTQKLNFSGIRTFTLLGKVHKKQACIRVMQALFLTIWGKTQAGKNSRISKTQAKISQNSSKIFIKLNFAGMRQYKN